MIYSFSFEGSEIRHYGATMTRKACNGRGEDSSLSLQLKAKNQKARKEKLIPLDSMAKLMSFIPKKE